ncbi:hypothetical protein S7335_788 [Synechococcus sp. PCC 7335]|uniref:hypothetical protein n=1 Tax=Synechococcus sp. (strain ATCC 29403 / PCC 7335) TaxID=91464 RepID=UPI00017ED9D5|nr:hypothetical protein [Synechococcus sp. PCC 7335]EDX83608.1 hypothetical protein S7335_788 [Synechococcus sp. PCC 7335]
MANPETATTVFMHPWTARYAKLVAITLLYGATVHLGNIAGLTGTPWLSTPLLWRWMDIALLIFNIVSAVSLWRGFSWSVWFVFGGIILFQFVPYIFLRSQFILKPEDAQTLNGLLGTEAILLSIFALLLWLKK